MRQGSDLYWLALLGFLLLFAIHSGEENVRASRLPSLETALKQSDSYVYMERSVGRAEAEEIYRAMQRGAN
jgi:hypothetical protein